MWAQRILFLKDRPERVISDSLQIMLRTKVKSGLLALYQATARPSEEGAAMQIMEEEIL